MLKISRLSLFIIFNRPSIFPIMGCTPNKNQKSHENGKQSQKEASPQLTNIQDIKYNPNNEIVLGPNTQQQTNLHPRALRNSYPSRETQSEQSQVGGSLRPRLENKLSDFVSSQNKTKYSITVTQKKWLNLQEIFSFPIQKQQKYWQWYLTDYQSDSQLRKSHIENPYAQLPPSEILKILSPQAISKIESALRSEPAQNQQIAFEKIMQEENEFPKLNLRENDFPKLNLRNEEINISGLRQQGIEKEKQQIYVMRDDDDNAFRQTFSVQIYENSEMSQVKSQIAIDD